MTYNDTPQRRAALLNIARSVAEKAQAEGRELSVAESDQINAALSEIRSIDERVRADAKSKELLGQLDLMAAGRDVNTGDTTRRLTFSKDMAGQLATKMLGDGLHSKAGLAPSGAAVVGQGFETAPFELGKPTNALLAALPVVTHPSAEFSYLRQATRTNLAAIVAEGATKPTSTYSIVRVEDSLKIIAHLSEGVPRFWFLDNESLQQFLVSELTFGLQAAVEAYALTVVNATSGIVLQAYATSTLAVLRKSLTTLETAGYEPGFMLVNPGDWEGVELALASTNAVEHLSLPYDASARRLFGVPVVVSAAQALGVSHTVGRDAVALDTDGRGVSVQWSESSNATDFEKNLIRARCEMRAALSVYQPAAIVKGDLTA